MTNLSDILAPSGLALKNNTILTGVPTAPNPAAATDTTQIATTSFTQAAIVAVVGSNELTIAAADTLVYDSAVHSLIPFYSDTLSHSATSTFRVAGQWTMNAHTGTVRISFTLNNPEDNSYESAEARVRVNGTTVYTVVNPTGPTSSSGSVDVTFVEGDVIDLVHSRMSNHGSSVISLMQMSADNFLILTTLGRAAL